MQNLGHFKLFLIIFGKNLRFLAKIFQIAIAICVKIVIIYGVKERGKMENKIFNLDYATTSPMLPEVYKYYLESFSRCQADNSSLYSSGRNAAEELKLARERIAKAIGAKADEIIFTSGATESNNLAIKGIARANKSKGNHIITCAAEHSSILESCKELEQEGFNVTYVPVDEFGVVDYASIIKSINPKTILISIMVANGEVGSLQPIRAIAELAKQNEVYFHTDAANVIGMLPIDVDGLGVDALTISSHKFGGPKGVGALYVKSGTQISSIISGAKQGNELRPGSLNVPALAAMGKAIELATADIEERTKKIRISRKYFQKKISEAVHNISLNGHPTQRIANICSICFEGANAEAVVMLLDTYGVQASVSSPSEFETNKPSHVLLAMGKQADDARTAVRFSFGPDISKEEIDEAVELIRKAVKKIRSISAIRIYKNKVEL